MSLFPPDEWVTVGHSPLEAIAEMMRSRLEAEGIEAVLRGNKASGTAGVINELNISWNNPLGGVEVRVHESDAETAREILAQKDEEEPEEARPVQPMVSALQWYVTYIIGFTIAFSVIGVTGNAYLALVLGLLGAGAVFYFARRSKK